MKNIKRLLILLILFIPVFVSADMSAPTLRPFEVVVTEPNGVDYIANDQTTGHLNKDDVVFVVYDYDGEYTLGREYTTDYGYTGVQSFGKVKSLSGFMIKQEEVDPAKLGKDDNIIEYDTEYNALVYNKNGVDLYKGPASVYKKNGHIKYGEVIKYKYAIRSESGITYIYTEYNGKKGWVDILKKNVLIKNENQYIFKNDVKSECGVIPKNTITTPNYKTDAWSHETLFEYKGCTTLLYSFRSDEILYVGTPTEEFPRTYITKVDMNMYESADSSSKVLKTVPAGSTIVMLAGGDAMAGTENIEYINFGDSYGWTLNNSTNDFEYTQSKYKKIKLNDNIIISNIDEITKKDAKKEDTKKETKKETKTNKLSSEELIIICAGGAVVLSLTAVVIIVLVNKKKKSKKKIEEEKSSEKQV